MTLPADLSTLSTPAPLYEQVKKMITDNISNGTWPPNHRIPSEAELVAHLGFSRMTINRALRELTHQGLLIRMQGVGTFVAEPKGQSALFEVHSIRDEILARNHRHHCKIILLVEAQANSEQAAALNLGVGSRLFHSIIVHYENDTPVQIENRYVNPVVAPDYLQQDFLKITPHDYLSRVAPLTEGEHIVEAVLPSAEESQWLHIHASEPCLLIERRTWSKHHNVTYAKLLFPGARHRLKGHFTS